MAAQGADSEHERPVHREHLARDERRLVRRKIRDRRGDVLGLAEAAERRVRPMSACFVQEYVTSHDAPCWPQIDEMFTMQPLFSCSMFGSTA